MDNRLSHSLVVRHLELISMLTATSHHSSIANTREASSSAGNLQLFKVRLEVPFDISLLSACSTLTTMLRCESCLCVSCSHCVLLM